MLFIPYASDLNRKRHVMDLSNSNRKDMTRYRLHYIVIMMVLIFHGSPTYVECFSPKLSLNQCTSRLNCKLYLKLPTKVDVSPEQLLLPQETDAVEDRSILNANHLGSKDVIADSEEQNVGLGQDFYIGIGQLFLICFIFATNPLAVRYMYAAIEHHPPQLLWGAGAAVTAAIAGSATTVLRYRSHGLENRKLLSDPTTQLIGAELGFWMFMGSIFNTAGLTLTTATQGAFCIQLTTLLVPILEQFTGVPVPGKVWTACLIAILGVGLITFDSLSSSASPELAQSILLGDISVVIAALFFAIFDVRLCKIGNKADSNDVVTGKMVSQAVYSIAIVLLLSLFDANQLQQIQTFFHNATTPELAIVIGVMLWNGLVVNYVATFLQLFAFPKVGASRSQVVLSACPLLAALLSYWVLGESFGNQGYLGGIAFIAALLLAASSFPEEKGESSQEKSAF